MVNNPSNWTKVWDVAKRPTAYTGGTTNSTSQPYTILSQGGRTQVVKASRVAGALPLVRGLGTVALAATALQVGWKIGRTIDTQWLHFSGDYGTTVPQQGQASNLLWYNHKGISWKWVAAGAVVNESTFTADANGFYLLYSECGNASPGCTPTGSFAGISIASTTAGAACNITVPSTAQTVVANLLSASGGAGAVCVASRSAATIGFIYLTETQFADAMRPNAYEPWVAQTADKTTTAHAVPADPGTGSATATDIRAALLGGSDEVDEEIAQAIQPGAVEDTVGTINLPEPASDETSADYRARLRALGWLGTATIVNYSADPIVGHPDYDPRFGPDASTKVKIKVGTVDEVVLPLPASGFPDGAPDVDTPTVAWPVNPPVIKLSDPIQFTVNPPTDSLGDPVPAPPGGGGGGDGGCPDCPPVDFGPVSELDYGETFPFGLFVWLSDLFDSTTGGAASCEFGSLDVPGGGTVDLDLCSTAWEDTYRAPVWLVGQFVMTVALVLGLARKVLGSKDGDDD